MYDDHDVMIERAFRHLEADPKTAFCPIDRNDRLAITKRYVLARAKGDSHAEAKTAALGRYGNPWMLVAWIAAQVIVAILKHWWENRHDEHADP